MGCGDRGGGPLEEATRLEAELVNRLDTVTLALDGLATVHVEAAKGRLADALTRLRERVGLAHGYADAVLALAADELRWFAAALERDVSGAASVPPPADPDAAGREGLGAPIRVRVG